MSDSTSKPKWASKMLWVNVIAAVSVFISSQFGYTISAEWQVIGLAGINAVLRLFTHQRLV